MLSGRSLLIAGRVLRGLRRDHRTLFLFIGSPAFVMILCAEMLTRHPQMFDRVGLLIMGMFPTAPGFLFAAFSLQRERHQGSLEYLLTAPVSRMDVLVGYVMAFCVPALAQVALMVSVSYGLLGLDSAGAWWAVSLMSLFSCVLGVLLGMFAINLAGNEFELTKMLPATAVPHVMVSGLFQPVKDLPEWMQAIALVAPWRYLVGAVGEFQTHSRITATFARNLGVTLGIVLLASVMTLLTVLNRRTA
ncbi:ABC transporter permease [Actinomadura meridiana]|uniref:ABC transporter permease n=1 Tax=Actinomadura meridiana TaxID=559626 RepID=A0ABP8BSR5_9ACTN